VSREITPNEQAWLDTIAWAEGTYGPQGRRYNITFGYQPIKDLSRHPDRVVKSGGYASAAAGAYQFMPGTWSPLQKRLGLPDFGPRSQDLAALQLMRDRGVDPAKDPISAKTLNKLASTWASFPTLKGGSYYGQPSKSLESLLKFAKTRGGFVDGTKYPDPDRSREVSDQVSFPSTTAQKSTLSTKALNKLNPVLADFLRKNLEAGTEFNVELTPEELALLSVPTSDSDGSGNQELIDEVDQLKTLLKQTMLSQAERDSIMQQKQYQNETETAIAEAMRSAQAAFSKPIMIVG
jgi:muramidase (phage lysozyme)